MATERTEAVKLIGDWAKWLVTIETAGLAVIGAVIKAGDEPFAVLVRIFVTSTVVCFVASIGFAAFLLLSLPEIVESSDHSGSVWLERDALIRVSVQTLAIVESFFFGLGVLSFGAMIVAMIWTR